MGPEVKIRGYMDITEVFLGKLIETEETDREENEGHQARLELGD